ncbi:unnamed protein product, partial [Discosporangium mesarthrocarpum]
MWRGDSSGREETRTPDGMGATVTDTAADAGLGQQLPLTPAPSSRIPMSTSMPQLAPGHQQQQPLPNFSAAGSSRNRTPAVPDQGSRAQRYPIEGLGPALEPRRASPRTQTMGPQPRARQGAVGT